MIHELNHKTFDIKIPNFTEASKHHNTITTTATLKSGYLLYSLLFIHCHSLAKASYNHHLPNHTPSCIIFLKKKLL